MNTTTSFKWRAVSYAVLLTILPFLGFSQTNHALTATSSHSGGGSAGTTNYSASNYNDGVIAVFGQTPWGWVSSNGSIEYTWTSSVSINSLVFHKATRMFTSLNVEYWDGSQYVLIMPFTGTAANKDSINFPTVSTTKLRMSSISGANPAFREIQAYYIPSAPIDAAVLSVDSPSVFCAGMQSVYATIANRGTSQLSSVTVNWEVNGILQTPLAYTQLLDTLNGIGNNEVQVLLGTAMFNSGSTNLKVYTSAPNNVADTVNSNDTIIASPTTASPPTTVSFTNITLSSADVAVAGGSGNVDYEYGVTGYVQSTGISGSTTNSMFTLSTLNSGTRYDVYVRSNCGSNDTSPWVGPFSFGTSNSVPFHEDFETFTAGQLGTTFTNGWSSTGTTNPRWESEVSTGANSNSTLTGPFFDATMPTTAGGKYMYLETSSPSSLGQKNTLSSPPIFIPTNGNTLVLEYSYHMFGSTMGNLYVAIDTNNVLDTIATLIGAQQAAQADSFKDTMLLLNGYSGKSIIIRFIGEAGSSFYSDMAIDEVHLFDTVGVNLALDSIISPVSDCGLSAASNVTVSINNVGLSAISNFPISYVLNGGTAVTETVTSTILPGTSLNYTFTSTLNLQTVGSYNLQVYFAVPGDGNVLNDSLRSIINSGFAQALNQSATFYYNDFEGATNNWVTYGVNNSWEIGTPSTFFINKPAGGMNAYVTSAAGNHNANELSYIETPCFDLSFFQVTDNFDMTFETLFKTQSDSDQVWMELSVNNGLSWTKVLKSSFSVNFYNNIARNTWDGFSSGGVGNYIPVLNTITGIGGLSQVKFRFVFKSNGSNQNDGFAIDNFRINSPLFTSIETQSKETASFKLFPNPANASVSISFQNVEADNLELTILDVKGQKVLTEWINMKSGNSIKVLDLSQFDKGVYFVRLANGNSIETKKLVVN